MSNYQTVNLPRDLAERIAKVCMFTLPSEDSQQLRTILAKPSGDPAAWFDPVHNDFLTAAGRATTISMGDGDRLARYTVPLYAAPTAAEELDSVRHWRGKHAEAIRERDQLQADLTGRDDRIDQLRSGYVFETGPYQVELSEEQWNAALDVFENYNMGDEQHFVFLEEQGRGVISEILIAIGVARAPDAVEVVE